MKVKKRRKREGGRVLRSTFDTRQKNFSKVNIKSFLNSYNTVPLHETFQPSPDRTQQLMPPTKGQRAVSGAVIRTDIWCAEHTESCNGLLVWVLEHLCHQKIVVLHSHRKLLHVCRGMGQRCEGGKRLNQLRQGMTQQLPHCHTPRVM